MGGTSTSKQTQSSTLSPYDPANPSLQGLLGGINSLVPQAGTLSTGQQGAIDKLQGDISNVNPQIMSGATGLLNGGGATNNDAAIKGNLTNYQGLLQPTASGANIGQNPALKAQLDQITTDVTNQTNGAWAAAGRDGSPGNAQALGRGIASGVAPVLAAQYNTDADRALNASGALYNAGNTTYGLLNGTQGTANSNIAAGANLGGAALTNDNAALTAELARTGIPLSQLQTLLGMVSPVAAQFGTQNGQSTGSNTMSGAQQFATIAGGIGSLMPKSPMSFGGVQNFGAV